MRTRSDVVLGLPGLEGAGGGGASCIHVFMHSCMAMVPWYHAVHVTHACRLSEIMYKITAVKFLEPSEGEDQIRAHCEGVRAELAEKIRSLEEEFR